MIEAYSFVRVLRAGSMGQPEIEVTMPIKNGPKVRPDRKKVYTVSNFRGNAAQAEKHAVNLARKLAVK